MVDSVASLPRPARRGPERSRAKLLCPLMSRIDFMDCREPAAATAYDIALDYLEGSGAVRDPYSAAAFVARELSALVERGEHNKIRLANLAIRSFERRYHIEH
jgi:hypothetical protein